MNQQLLNQVVEQVVAALQQRGVSVTPPASTPAAETDKSAAPAPPAASAKKSFLTVDVLRKRVGLFDTGPRALELAANEHLTPAAADEARRLNVTVTRKTQTVAAPLEPGRGLSSRPGTQTPGHAAPPIGLVVEGRDAAVEGLLGTLGRQKVRFRRQDASNCWMENLLAVCNAVASGQMRGGVALVTQAQAAVVLANKVRGIRAVAPASADALAAAVHGFAANVLVVDRGARTFHEMRQLLAGFAPAQAGADIGLMAALGKLEKNG